MFVCWMGSKAQVGVLDFNAFLGIDSLPCGEREKRQFYKAYHTGLDAWDQCVSDRSFVPSR